MGKKTVGIGNDSKEEVQSRCIVIESDNMKENPRLQKNLKDKALIAVHTKNDDTQHIPSHDRHSDSRISTRKD